VLRSLREFARLPTYNKAVLGFTRCVKYVPADFRWLEYQKGGSWTTSLPGGVEAVINYVQDYIITPNDPYMTFDPTCVWVMCKAQLKNHLDQVPLTCIKFCERSDQLCPGIYWPQMTPWWPLTPLMLGLCVGLNPWIILNESHWNPSIYVDAVTNYVQDYIITPNDPYMTFDPTCVRVMRKAQLKNHLDQVPLKSIKLCERSDQLCPGIYWPQMTP
jgi:hypothetical protein